MIIIFLVFLFITQIISFYFLALMHTKISTFDDLKKKQQTLMNEMDDSIAAYLSELKDENDRLIERLSFKQQKQHDEIPQEPAAAPDELKIPTIPMNLAIKSYGATTFQTLKPTNLEIPQVEVVVNERDRAFQLYDEGYSIEEIARKLDKGRTEVELLIKFR